MINWSRHWQWEDEWRDGANHGVVIGMVLALVLSTVVAWFTLTHLDKRLDALNASLCDSPCVLVAPHPLPHRTDTIKVGDAIVIGAVVRWPE